MVSNSNKPINNSLFKYKTFIVMSIILIISIYLSYKLSKSYRLSLAKNELNKLDGYINISSNLNKNKEYKLCDFYISSAFRPYLAKRQFFDYIDLSITESIIKNGVRAMYIDIFNSNLGTDSEPIISSGYKEGQWKFTFNTILFDDFCKLIMKTCFNPGYVNNYEDPFILMLNLNTNNNIYTLNKIKDILLKRLKKYLLPNKYIYSKVNIGQTPIKYFKKKLLIFSSDGYQNSDLEELINYSWDKPALKKINYKSLYPSDENEPITEIKLDGNDIKDFNKNNLTIVVPNEKSIYTGNYESSYFLETGCQLVSMNYQIIDTFMDSYITKFKNESFILKPNILRGAPIKETINLYTTFIKNDDVELEDPEQTCAIEPTSQ